MEVTPLHSFKANQTEPPSLVVGNSSNLRTCSSKQRDLTAEIAEAPSAEPADVDEGASTSSAPSWHMGTRSFSKLCTAERDTGTDVTVVGNSSNLRTCTHKLHNS